jgi:acid-sensing ion channel, other
MSQDFKVGRNLTLNQPTLIHHKVFATDYPLSSSQKPGSGLEVVLSRIKRDDKIGICTAFSFIVHSPYELPGSYDLTEMCEFHYGFDFDVLITPEIIRTDRSLRSMTPKKRGCYFEGEKKLRFFKVYTRRNCEFECLADLLINHWTVNCTQFFMARNDSTEVCDHRQERFAQYITYYALRNISMGRTNCGCLDECDLIKYDMEIVAHTVEEYNETLGREQADIDIRLNFKFKDVDIVPLRRYLPFTFNDFLAQSGGMWGLFAGISMLSLVELIYFITSRWTVNLWRWKKSRRN